MVLSQARWLQIKQLVEFPFARPEQQSRLIMSYPAPDLLFFTAGKLFVGHVWPGLEIIEYVRGARAFSYVVSGHLD